MTQQPPSGLTSGSLGTSPPPSSRPLRSGALGTAVIIAACAWTASLWALPLASVVSGSDIVYGLLALLSFIVMIAAYVLVGIWLWRARGNADLVAPDQQRRGRSWVWFGWFVPIASFFVPKQVIDDVWRSTVSGFGTPRTGWWWGTWIIMCLTQKFGIRNTNLPGSEMVSYDLIVAVATTVAAVFWIRVVRTVSHAQDALTDATVAPF